MKKALIVNDTSPENHVGCFLVMRNIRRVLSKAGFSEFYYHPVSKDWRNSEDFFNVIDHVDLIVVNGEGSIHGSNSRAVALTEISHVCQEHKKKSCLLNSTIYNNSSVILENVSNFDFIFVRDGFSLSLLNQLGINAYWTPDFSFFNDLSFLRISSGNGVAVTDTVVGEDKKLLESLSLVKGFTYMPLKLSKGYMLNLEAYLKIFGEMQANVTGRFHSACISLNMGVPFLCLESNTPKISFLLDDVFGERSRVKDKFFFDKFSICDVPGFSAREKECISSYKSRGQEAFAFLQNKIGSGFEN